MKRWILALFAAVFLLASARPSFAGLPGEGYAWPTFKELVQTFVALKGLDITDPKVTDLYGKIVYCSIYEKEFSNDMLWKQFREKIVARFLKQKEYYRVRYQVVIPFDIGHYDFKKQYFPIASRQSFENVGYLSLSGQPSASSPCLRGRNLIFTAGVTLKTANPLTIKGFSLPEKDVAKIMARMVEGRDKKRKVYARIRVLVTGAEKGVNVSADNYVQMVLTGKVVSVDFFLDSQLTEPVGQAIVIR